MSTDLKEAEAAPAAVGAPPPTVLLVDDEPSVLSALRRLFRLHGFRPLTAGGGAEALAILKSEEVQVILSDMRMPGMDGAQFLEQARALRPDAMRLLLTGYADIQSTIAAVNRGEIHRYLTKPWDDQDLMLVVRDLMARQSLERRNAELTEVTRRQNDLLQEANRTLEARVQARTAEIAQVNDMLEAAYGDLDRTFSLAVNVLSGLLEMRGGNAGHARRVAELARATAQRLKLGEREVRDVELGALLHDIGKIALPDRMLGRPVSTYSGDDIARYRRHPVDGETALMPLVQLRAAARIVRQHHERPDGLGFPDGIGGAEIVLGARIVSAASDYDGLVHGGAAEIVHSPERAAQLLRGGIGTRYDGDVVDALLAAVQEGAAVRDGVEIEVRQLKAGMVLARDLLSPAGAILLAKGYVFDERLVRQVGEFASREGIRMTLHVRSGT